MGMTKREQSRFDRLATAVRRILAYQTSRQILRGAERQYGLAPIEALEYAYDNLRGEAEAVRDDYPFDAGTGVRSVQISPAD